MKGIRMMENRLFFKKMTDTKGECPLIRRTSMKLFRIPAKNPVLTPAVCIGKNLRDRDQAMYVARLVIQHLPQYAFKRAELKMFPKELLKQVQEQISEMQGFLGFEI